MRALTWGRQADLFAAQHYDVIAPLYTWASEQDPNNSSWMMDIELNNIVPSVLACCRSDTKFSGTSSHWALQSLTNLVSVLYLTLDGTVKEFHTAYCYTISGNSFSVASL